MGGGDSMFAVQEVLIAAQAFAQMHLYPLASSYGSEAENVVFDVSSVTRFSDSSSDSVSELCRAAHTHDVHVFCDNEGERERLHEMILEQSFGVQMHSSLLPTTT